MCCHSSILWLEEPHPAHDFDGFAERSGATRQCQLPPASLQGRDLFSACSIALTEHTDNEKKKRKNPIKGFHVDSNPL